MVSGHVRLGLGGVFHGPRVACHFFRKGFWGFCAAS